MYSGNAGKAEGKVGQFAPRLPLNTSSSKRGRDVLPEDLEEPLLGASVATDAFAHGRKRDEEPQGLRKDRKRDPGQRRFPASGRPPSARLWVKLLCLAPVLIVPPTIRTLVLAHLPDMILQFFSIRGRCASLHPDDSVAQYACASTPANEWKATFDTTAAVVGFVCLPLVSAASDVIGRRPIVMLSVLSLIHI